MPEIANFKTKVFISPGLYPLIGWQNFELRGLGPSLVVNINVIANYICTRALLCGEMLKKTETEETVDFVLIF